MMLPTKNPSKKSLVYTPFRETTAYLQVTIRFLLGRGACMQKMPPIFFPTHLPSRKLTKEQHRLKSAVYGRGNMFRLVVSIFLYFTPKNWGRWTQFDSYFSNGLVQPPTRLVPWKVAETGHERTASISNAAAMRRWRLPRHLLRKRPTRRKTPWRRAAGTENEKAENQTKWHKLWGKKGGTVFSGFFPGGFVFQPGKNCVYCVCTYTLHILFVVGILCESRGYNDMG